LGGGGGGGFATSGRGKVAGKKEGVNMVQILCTHVCKYKNDAY
jgi:hypothetical protein